MISNRILGNSGLSVSALGMGCLPFSGNYGPVNDADSVAIIHHVIELGVTFIDTAAMYGSGHNELLVGRAIKNFRDDIILSSKCGRSRDPERAKEPDGRPESIALTCEESLARLKVDYIDLYYLHRANPSVPIEESVGAMAQLVERGKVRHLGLSEVSSATLERAAAIHPITALQSEWSLWAREIEDDVLATARRLDVGIVPFSPLGRGFLAGRILAPEDLDPSDHRRRNERYQDKYFQHNWKVFSEVRCLADEIDVTPAQIALAWLLGQGTDVIPIFGAQRKEFIDENLLSCALELTPEIRSRLTSFIAPGVWEGAIFPGSQKTRVYGETPIKSQASSAEGD